MRKYVPVALTPGCPAVESGADAGLMGITCYMGALHVMALVNNGASLTDGNSVSPAQVTSIKVKEESVDLTLVQRAMTNGRALLY